MQWLIFHLTCGRIPVYNPRRHTEISLPGGGRYRVSFPTPRYEPGLWENWFGVDPGSDCLPLIPDLFADDKDPRWRRFKASGLSEWPPRLDPTAADPTAPQP